MGGCSSKTEPQNRLQMLEQRVETLTKMLETSDNNATKTSVITKVEEKQVHHSFVDQENRLSQLEEQLRDLTHQNATLSAKNLELSNERKNVENANKKLKIKMKQIKSLSAQLLAEQQKTQSRINNIQSRAEEPEQSTQTAEALYAATEKALHLANMELEQQRVAYTAAEARSAQRIRDLESENQSLRQQLAHAHALQDHGSLEDSLEDVDISQSATVVTMRRHPDDGCCEPVAELARTRKSKASVRIDISPPPTRRKQVQQSPPQNHAPRGGVSFIA